MKTFAVGLVSAMFALTGCETTPRTYPARDDATGVDGEAVYGTPSVAAVTFAPRDDAEALARDRARAEADDRRADQQEDQLADDPERTARFQQELETLSAKTTPRGIMITLYDTAFDAGKARLPGNAVRSLERVAGVLKNHPERRVLVEGFTDSEGTESSNLELARRRADAVKDRLEAFGLADKRVETRGYGEAYPVADNATPEGRQQNRRVEIFFSDDKGQFSPR